MRCLCLLFAVACLPGSACWGQLPQARLDRIFPLGGEAGSTVVVDIAGKDIDDVRTLRFDHPGLKAEFVKANQFRVHIAADTPPGTYEVRAVGKWGISGSRLLAVSRGLTEVRQAADGNTSRDKAQPIASSAAVNGVSRANASDFFRFRAGKGERVTIDCQAERLDSPLQPVLALMTPEGKVLEGGQPYFGRTDPLIDFTAPAEGEYVLELRDSTYVGDRPYRLIVSNRPVLESAFPAAARPGEKVELRLHGKALSFTVPADAGRQLGRFLYHPGSAALNADILQLRPQGTDATGAVTLACVQHPRTQEREPNNTPETAQGIKLPTVLCGRFDQPGDVDWYTFKARAGQVVAVDLLCERLELPGDALVLLYNTKGDELAAFDDHGVNSEALTQLNRDPAGVYTIPEDGTYRLSVQERLHRGGPRYLYVLRIGAAEPHFHPVVVHETTNEASCPVLRAGGAALYDLCLNRWDGFGGEATVEAEGLPPGVSCRPVHVGPGNELASVVFMAAADAPPWTGAIRLKAWARIDGKRIERPVGCVQRRFSDQSPITSSRANREICLAVRSRAPYSLETAAREIKVRQGESAETKVTLTRHWPEVKETVRIAAWKPPAGFEVGDVQVPAGSSTATVKITPSADVAPGTYSVILRGDTQVPFSADPAAKEKPNVRVFDPAPPLTIVVVPAAAK
jgi:hypothetical protein